MPRSMGRRSNTRHSRPQAWPHMSKLGPPATVGLLGLVVACRGKASLLSAGDVSQLAFVSRTLSQGGSAYAARPHSSAHQPRHCVEGSLGSSVATEAACGRISAAAVSTPRLARRHHGGMQLSGASTRRLRRVALAEQMRSSDARLVPRDEDGRTPSRSSSSPGQEDLLVQEEEAEDWGASPSTGSAPSGGSAPSRAVWQETTAHAQAASQLDSGVDEPPAPLQESTGELEREYREEFAGDEDEILADDLQVQQAALQDWKSGRRALAELWRRGLTPSASSYVAVIKACGKAFRWDVAIHLLKEVRQRGQQLTIEIYNAALQACEMNSQWAWTMRLFKSLRRINLQPNVDTYRYMIRACRREQKWKQAIQLLEFMGRQGLECPTAMLSDVVQVCADQHQLSRVMELLSNRVEAPGDDRAPLYERAIRAMAGEGRWKLASGLLQEALSKGCAPGCTLTYTMTIEACGAAKQWELSLSILSDMEKLGSVTPDALTYDAAARALEKVQRWTELKEVEDERSRAFAALEATLSNTTMPGKRYFNYLDNHRVRRERRLQEGRSPRRVKMAPSSQLDLGL
mmetsp:Transcript_93013/g.300590  ORF Transcript_93013/g.300590 Transcript_93013/m.300590 type:complete len:574 (+) Transcript_93013:47-1768(+)|eukprot:CAMPEP_0203902244 /NCGR_PEP_ID=MMETSP0359-20131031/44309_1 /ASSEMBLY_ACC=CAM_ASM_000338 /TAXON_ID=268821 /ORGANISM="Scrippsiella Hangoei, Strain SHTV-5" /LENGTH=573 /DNA_ID=CAMNT_0050826053 /DNA_START=24 /DNA_END=1745 /DNA_ORIENTATION=-